MAKESLQISRIDWPVYLPCAISYAGSRCGLKRTAQKPPATAHAKRGVTLGEFHIIVSPTRSVYPVPNYRHFLPHIAHCTADLHRLEVTYVNPNDSFLQVTKANPGLRSFLIYLEPFPDFGDIVRPNEAEDRVVRTVCDFLTNCPQIEDIVIKEYKYRRISAELFPKTRRIHALDSKCSLQRPHRKVGIRVGSTFYDIM